MIRLRPACFIAPCILFLGLQVLGQEVSAKDIFVARNPASKQTLNKTEKAQLAAGSVAGYGSLDEVPTNDAFASVGRGYDPITGRLLNIVCVEGTEPDHDLGDGTITRTNMQVVTDEKSYAKASSSSVGFSALIKVVSVGAGTSSADSSMFNSVDQYARIYSRVATVGTERRNVRWSSAAQKLLKTDLERFLAECGTRFVRAVYAGHLMDESVHFSLREDQQNTANATTLSLGVAKLFSASASFCDAQSSMHEIANTELKHYGRGVLSLPPAPPAAGTSPPPGAGTPSGGPPLPQPAPAPSTTTSSASCSAQASAPSAPPSPLQTMVDYYNTGFIPAVIADKKKSALPLYLVTDRYIDNENSLKGAQAIPYWTDELTEAVLAKGDTYDDLVGAISDTRFALKQGAYSHLTPFYVEDETAAKKKQDAATKMLREFQQAIKFCQTLAIDGQEDVPDPTRPGSTVAAVTLCQQRLDASVDDAKVGAVKLTRKYQ